MRVHADGPLGSLKRGEELNILFHGSLAERGWHLAASCGSTDGSAQKGSGRNYHGGSVNRKVG